METVRDLVVLAFVMGLLVLVASPALAQAPQPPPNADQVATQLCDMGRVQGDKNAGAIIAQNLKTIADLQAEVGTLKAAAEKAKAGEKK